MSKPVLCVGNGTPAPRPRSGAVAVVAVLIVVLGMMGSASAWQGAVDSVLAETAAALAVAAVMPPAHDRT